jgi:hypothetical protein
MTDVRYQVAINRSLDAALTKDAAEIEVQQTIEGPTTFRVRFSVDVCDGDMEPLSDPRLNPGTPDTEVTVLAYVDGKPFVLSHGVITQHQAKLERGGAGSYVDVQGSDRRVVMERVARRESHAGKASDAVDLIVRRYGFEPDIAETEIEYGEGGNTLNQTESDLAFVNTLAGRNGMRFWIDWEAETGPAGFDVTEIAHFRPSPARPETNPFGFLLPLLLAPSRPAVLRLNTADRCAAAASFEVTSNAEAPNRTGPIERVEPGSGRVEDTEVPGPSDEPLGEAPTTAGEERSQTLVTPGGVDEARVRNAAALNDAAWTVNATAEASARVLGTVVMPHQMLRVEGTGRLNDGDYFVKAVTHTISAADHKMRIELLRNALGAA